MSHYSIRFELLPYRWYTPRPFFFFFNDTATTEIYTLSLHDALPISERGYIDAVIEPADTRARIITALRALRSEEHTSELQSQSNLVCRLLLEKKKKWQYVRITSKQVDKHSNLDCLSSLTFLLLYESC